MNKHHKRFTVVGAQSIGENTVILTTNCPLESEPGQYVMVWLPGVSENPLSIMDGSPLKLAVKKVPSKDKRPFSHEIFRAKEIFVRGPYGRGFSDFIDYDAEHYLVAGGVGAAPLSFLASRLREGSSKPHILLGIRDNSELGWEEYFGACETRWLDPCDVMVSTNDGSYGKKGLVTGLFDDIDPPENSQFFICGPEKMMVAAAEKASRYTSDENVILSIERYMKCAEGICGGCGITGADNRGYDVCRDGPVFQYSQLKGGDFGKRHRLKSGLKVQME